MLSVLPNQGNLNRRKVLRDTNCLLPHLPQGVALGDPIGRQMELLQVKAFCKQLEQPLLVQQKGDLIYGLHIVHADDLLEVDLAAPGYLPDGGVIQGSVAAASDLRLSAPVQPPLVYVDTHQIGDQASAAHLPDCMLGRLGFLFSMDSWMFASQTTLLDWGFGFQDPRTKEQRIREC